MSQITRIPSHTPLVCSACQAAVGVRYERCLSCRSAFHLACVDSHPGCQSATPKRSEPLSAWGVLYVGGTRSPLLSPTPRLGLVLSAEGTSSRPSPERGTEGLSGVQGFLLFSVLSAAVALLIWNDPSLLTLEVLLAALSAVIWLLYFGVRAWEELFGSPFWGGEDLFGPKPRS